FVAVAVLLLHPVAFPQNALPQNLIAPVSALAVNAASAPAAGAAAPDAETDAPALSSPAEPFHATPAGATPAPGLILIRAFRTSGAPLSPEFAALEPSPAALASVRSVAMEQQEERSRRRMWLELSAVQHSAAAFDAWSTRRAISSGGGRELNPMLR